MIGRLHTNHLTADAVFTYRTTHIRQGLYNCFLNWGPSQLVTCFDAYQHAMLNLHQPRHMPRCDTDQHAMLTDHSQHLVKPQAIPYGPRRRVHHDRSSIYRTHYGECVFFTYRTTHIVQRLYNCVLNWGRSQCIQQAILIIWDRWRSQMNVHCGGDKLLKLIIDSAEFLICVSN